MACACRPPHRPGVARDHVDDLARWEAVAKVGAEVGSAAGDELLASIGRGQPVGDGTTVATDSGRGLDDAEPGEGERPPDDCMHVPVRNAAVERAADEQRCNRLGEHPEHAEEHARGKRPALAMGQPGDEASRRTRVRNARVGQGQDAHR